MKEKSRSTFSGNIGFVLAAAGSAVGLGNIWRFPYLAAKDGGGLFLLVYLILVLTFGFALLTTEIAIGRKTGQGPLTAYGLINPKGKFIGVLACIVPAIILPYYCTIGGWVLKYFTLFITGSGKNAVADGYFTGFITGQWAPIIFGVVYLLITAAGAMPSGGAQAGMQGKPPVGPDGKPLPVPAGEEAEKPVSFAVQLLIFGLCVVVAVGITAYSIFSNLVLTSDNMTLKARVSDLSYAQNIYDVYNQTKKDYDWTKLLESASSNKNDEITGFVDELEQKLPSEAKLVNMSVTTDGVSMTIKTGSKDIAADVIAQLRTFESIMVSNVSTITEEVDETGASKVQFTVDCTYVKADDSAASESADGTGSEPADTSGDTSSQAQTDSNSSSDTDSTNQ